MSKPTIIVSWDWFYEESRDDQRFFDEGAIGAAVAEDGDEEEATRIAKAKVTGNVKTASYNPCVGDCVLVVAWDADRVSVAPEEWDQFDWDGFE